MARLDPGHPAMRAALLAMACPPCAPQPWVTGPALSQRRVALLSTAGLHRRDDQPFAVTAGNARAMAGDYRVIPDDIAANDLVMSHVSTNFDRTGFQQDWNVVFPLDRLHELQYLPLHWYRHTHPLQIGPHFHFLFRHATDQRHAVQLPGDRRQQYRGKRKIQRSIDDPSG